jgi:hypothetical protein
LLGAENGPIDRAPAFDRDRRPVDVLGPIGRREAAPDPELDADVRAVLGIVGIDGGDRAGDGRRIERAALHGLQLRPGDVQHHLAEEAFEAGEVGNGEGGWGGSVVE